jgi:hypothetical protein
MRINALYVAIVLLLAGTVPRWWAHADVGSHRIEVGLRGFVEMSGSSLHEDRLAELNGMGRAFEQRGFVCFVLGIAAAVACAIASELERRNRLAIVPSVALAVPIGASAVMTCVFAADLANLKYLDLGRSVWLCLAGALVGAAALIAPRRQR